MDKANDSHLSHGARADQPPGPTRQKHRMACGDKVTGMTDPNGAAPNTASRLGGATKNY